MGALFVVAATLLAGACIALAGGQVARVSRARPSEIDALRSALRRLPFDARAAALAERAQDSGWLRELGEGLRDATSPSTRVAAANDVLGDVARTLDAGAAWPSAAVRLAAFGGLLLVALGLLADAGAVVVTLVAGLAGVAAVLAAVAGQRARRASAALREAIDDLVALCAPPEDRADPVERAPRRGRRSGRL